MKQSYRYPGTQSFQKEDAGIFFGRDEDIRHLLRLIRLEQLVILYGKSGLGKTSLLNAGLLPGLESEQAAEEIEDTEEEASQLVVKEIRFGAFQEGITDQSLNVLRQQFQANTPIHPLFEQLVGQPKSLWHHFKNKQLHERDNSTTLLVFDQFEELFTYPQQDIETFKQEFSDLLNGNIPDHFQKEIINRLRENRKAFSREDKHWLNKPLNIKVIIGIRSDRLSLLDQFTDQLPNMLINLYELKPLNRVQARSAILKPAEKQSATFLTPPFAYDPKAMETMLDELSNQQGEIESFQLQLLCQYLEGQVLENPNLKTIQTKHFGGSEGVQTILNNYYEREIAKLPTDNQTIARRFIEEGLIVNEKRVAVAAGSEQARFGISKDLLQQLLNSRLIRTENIHLGKIYELSHDTLVEPILKSYEKSKAHDDRLEAERELERQKEQLRQEKKRRQRARLYAILGFTLFLLALVAGIFALRNAKTAKTQERQAKASALAAKAWEAYQYDHTLALRMAESAFTLDPQNADVKQTLRKIINSPKTSFYQKVLDEHQFEIEDIVFSADSKYMATCSHDTDIRIWDQEGHHLHRLIGKYWGNQHQGHRATVKSIAFSPDGTQLVSVSIDQMVKIWDIEKESVIREFRGHHNEIYTVHFSHQSDWFVTGGADSLAHIWTLGGDKKITLNQHQGAVTSLDISADDQKILTGSSDGTAILWSSSGQFIRKFQNEGGPVLSVAFFPDNERFVMGNSNKTAEVWAVNGNKIRSLGGHNGQVTDVDVSPDGSFILTASEDATAKIWSLEGEELLTLTGHLKRLNTIVISPEGKTIATGGFDFTVKMWDVGFNLDIQRNKHTDFIYSIDVSEDNTKIVTGSKDQTAKIWDFSGKMIADCRGHQAQVQSAFFIPGRSEVVTSSYDGTVRVWNFDGQELLYLEHGEPVFCARSSPDRQQIIAGTYFGKVFSWDQNGQLVKQWQAAPPQTSILHLEFSPDYDKILTAHGNSIRIWTKDGILLDSIINPNVSTIYRASFAPDGQTIYTAADEYPIREWTLNGELVQSYFGHFNVTYWITHHPNQPYLATASWDNTVKIWDMDGNIQKSIAHPNGVYTVDFSKDGKYLITGSHDNIGRIWDMDGKLINALGERINIEQTTQSVATLSDIPYTGILDLSFEARKIVFGDNPNLYLAEGNNFEEMAMAQRSDLKESSLLFDRSLEMYKKANQLSQNDSLLRINQILASTLKEKGEMLLTHRQFNDAQAAFTEGLSYEQQDNLIILQTLTYLYLNQFEKAKELALIYKNQPTPQIDWYDTFADAFLGELDFFNVQFNLSHPDAERFKKLFEKAEE